MNRSIRIALVAAVVVLLAVSGFATELSFNVPVTLNGKQLAPGKYKVKLTENGGATEVVFYQGKTAVASAPAKLVDNARAFRYDGFVLKQNPDGSNSLTEIQFAGKKGAVMIENAGAALSIGK
jgi:hypothetical protein